MARYRVWNVLDIYKGVGAGNKTLSFRLPSGDSNVIACLLWLSANFHHAFNFNFSSLWVTSTVPEHPIERPMMYCFSLD